MLTPALSCAVRLVGNTGVTSCVLAAQPESAGTARHFTREVLLSWGFGQLADEAETIIGELVVNAVQHGTRDTGGHGWCASPGHARRTTGYPRARAAWASRLTDAANPSAGVPSAGIPGPPGIRRRCGAEAVPAAPRG